MRIRGSSRKEKIGKFKVEKEAKYLGVQIVGKGREVFRAENKIWIQKAETKANELISQIKSSCDMVVVGKAVWKMMAIPSILFGRAVIPTSDTKIEKLQRIENKVWRYLLGIGGYSTIEALRGEIGASMIKSRIMETMLAYLIDTMASEFTNMKNMMRDTIGREKGRWYDTINRYRLELGLTWERLETMNRATLKKIIRKYDDDNWNLGLISKPVLRFYSKEKKSVGYEFCYRNNYSSKLYARARINALQLEEHKGRGKENYDTTCRLCGVEREDIVHFITKCSSLEQKRDCELMNRNINDPEDRMRELLFRNKNHMEISRMIKNMWELRRKLLNARERKTPQKDQSTVQNVNLPSHGDIRAPCQNPPPSGWVSEPDKNPPQSDRVSEFAKFHLRVVGSPSLIKIHL